MKKLKNLHIQFFSSLIAGLVGACSPTKFNVESTPICTSSNESCVVIDDYTNVTQKFEVGSGKVDILFINDNSASMSAVQLKLANRFEGFIEQLDRKKIDYQIGITTTDLEKVKSNNLIPLSNGNKFLTNKDANRVSFFKTSIVRSETFSCEDFIKSSYYSYKPNFLDSDYYINNYDKYCASADERGIYTGFEVLSKNSDKMLRDDAHLNIILISNEDVRSGLYNDNNSENQYLLEENDKADNFTAMMNSKYPNKFWEFNSIIVTDQQCLDLSKQSLVDRSGNVIKDANGNSVTGASIGSEYAKLSLSASKDVDGYASPRGQVLNICSNDYASSFSNIAAKILDSSRMLTLKCKPTESPIVTDSNGSNLSVPYTWDGNNQIVFKKGSEGISLNVNYKCYSGVK